jgi:hypothetical protein
MSIIMPSHSSSAKKADPDAARPVMDNARAMKKSAVAKKNPVDVGVHPSRQDSYARAGAVVHPGKSVSSDAQQATSLPGKLGVIDPHAPTPSKAARKEGIPGIIQSTTEGAQTRARLVGGIIDSPMSNGKAPSGPVHAVMGSDSTAYNAGFRHIAGSPFK